MMFYMADALYRWDLSNLESVDASDLKPGQAVCGLCQGERFFQVLEGDRWLGDELCEQCGGVGFVTTTGGDQ